MSSIFQSNIRFTTVEGWFTGDASIYNDFIAITNLFLFFSPEGVRLIALQRTTDTLALFLNGLLKPLIGYEFPMLVLIRVAVLAVREAVVFMLRVGWYGGRALLIATIIVIILIFDALGMARTLMNHSRENMCDTSFMQRFVEAIGGTTRDQCLKGDSFAL